MMSANRTASTLFLLTLFATGTLSYASETSVYQMMRAGKTAYEQGQFAKAESYFTRILASDTKYVPALKGLAQVRTRQKAFPEAAALYKKALWLSPADLKVRLSLADLYSWMGDYDRAISNYEDIVQQDSLNLEALSGLGRVLRWAMRYDDAEFYYNLALKIDPDNGEVLRGIARVYSLQGNFSKAMETVRLALQSAPQDPENLTVRGQILAWNNLFDEAEKSYWAALKLTPGSAEIYESLGDLYRWQKKYGQAIQAYRKALRLNPREVRLMLQQARVYKNMNMRSKAKDMVKKAFQIQPDNAEGMEILRALESQQSMDFAMVLNNYFEPAILLGSLLVVAVYSRWRMRAFGTRQRRYRVFSYQVAPSIISIWLLLIVLEYFIDFASFPMIREVVEFATLVILAVAFVSLWKVPTLGSRRQPKVVLAIGAHPDDIELGCGGTLAKFKDLGYEVHAMVASAGENGNPHTSKGVSRKEEAQNAAKILGVDSLRVLAFKDTQFSTQFSALKTQIEELIKKTRAQVVITQSPHDVHQDHRTIFEATKIAARGATSLLCFEDVSTEPHFNANYFVDITEHIEGKIKAVAAHKTQKDKFYMQPERIRGRAAHRGLQSGVPFAEAFLMYRGLDV